MDVLDPDRIKFARCVCTSTECSEFPVQRLGSGFTFLIGEDICLITARHVFANNSGNPLGLIVPPVDGSTTWWPSDATVHLGPGPKLQEHSVTADLALYSMHTSAATRVCLTEYDFIPIPASPLVLDGVQLFALGYPHHLAEMDSENGQLIMTLAALRGRYGGRTDSLGICSFESEDLLDVDPNGMSGGPVTACLPDGRHFLVGVIVQGSSQSGLLHFISAEWLANALEFSYPLLRKCRAEFFGSRLSTE